MKQRGKLYYLTIVLSVVIVTAFIGSHVFLHIGNTVQTTPKTELPKIEPVKTNSTITIVKNVTSVPTIVPTQNITTKPTIVSTPVPTIVPTPVTTESPVTSTYSSQVPIIPYHTVEVVQTIVPVANTSAEPHSPVNLTNTTGNDTLKNGTVGDWKYPYLNESEENDTIINDTVINTIPPATEFYRYVPYTYDGNRTVIMLTLNSTVYGKFASKDNHCQTTLEACYHRYVDDNTQKEYMESLVRDIRYTSDNTDIQAQHAIRFVQSLPYNDTSYREDPSLWHYPYQTLYNDGGVCSDKSELLVYLLRELGFATVIFHFSEEDHAAVGIKTNHTLGYAETEYTFIETTTPSMIGYANMTYNNGTMKLHTIPDVITMSTGKTMGKYANEEFNDAMEMNRLDLLGGEIDKTNYTEWRHITNKYGM
jgi:hypothetical protein